MAVSSPPSGTNGVDSSQVTPASQAATSTVADQIDNQSVAANQNDAELTKIVKTSPGV